jgi:hypothetical protein
MHTLPQFECILQSGIKNLHQETRRSNPSIFVEGHYTIFDPFWTLQLYVTVFTVLIYIIPTVILIFCYGCICYTVWKRGRVGEPITPGYSNHIVNFLRRPFVRCEWMNDSNVPVNGRHH